MNKIIKQALEMRDNYRKMIPSAGSPDLVKNISSISITTSDGYEMPARLYIPEHKNDSNKPAILFVHGGGFVSGDLDTHDVLCRALTNGLSAVILAINYRLAPEYPAPVGVEDSYEALKWLYQQADKLKIDRNAIAIVGDSAGGCIAIVLSQLAKERNGPSICAQWLMYPCTSFDLDTPSFYKFGKTNFPTIDVMKFMEDCYVQNGIRPNDPIVSPLYGEHDNLPPTLISVGDNDPLYDGCIKLGEALNSKEVSTTVKVYKDSVHGFIQFFKDSNTHPEGKNALQDGFVFLSSYIN